MRTVRNALLVVWVAALALLGIAGQAAAHNALVSSDPADGDRLDTAPAVVTLTFDQPVQDADVNQLAVTGPDGEQWATGEVRVARNVVTAPLRPLGPAGEYIIGFRILSADGHPVSEEIRFTLTTPGAAAPSAPDTSMTAEPTGQAKPEATATVRQREPAEDSGIPVWVWVVGAVVLLGAGLTLALRMGKSSDE
ncbi:hypothetical protein FHU38_004857 [Saccharomonospora amisosensis]|uniref:CopC domain-containing protein n=1 Tax=Saccharomonospora amisosensis TaxID=1128677 RepID=A0A7X5ZTC3_9PSEU|nr:copper resistance CopC family protein [Saccharomonospora amisosensis]NIJ14456.1 hypothetical protein [Saccharomonospora amisosensis]